MTRGKHAVVAARQRVEARDNHIDRLTDQLVEAKTRARTFERDALRVPHLEQEIARLLQLIEVGSSDTLERVRDDHEKIVADLVGRLKNLATVLLEISECHPKIMTACQIEKVDLAIPGWSEASTTLPREIRRARLKKGGAVAALRGATDSQLHENGIRRVGHLLRVPKQTDAEVLEASNAE